MGHHRPQLRLWLVAAGSAAGVLASATALDAATATSSFTVNATVLNECSIQTTPLALGAYDPVAANKTSHKVAEATVTITCTRGATTTIGLDSGSHASGSQRRMKDAGTNYLAYDIYQDPSCLLYTSPSPRD